MKQGKWVRHRFLDSCEAIILRGGIIFDERGYVSTVKQFEAFRFGNSNTFSDWIKGWEVCPTPVLQIEGNHGKSYI